MAQGGPSQNPDYQNFQNELKDVVNAVDDPREHQEQLNEALESLNRLLISFDGLSPEDIADCAQKALEGEAVDNSFAAALLESLFYNSAVSGNASVMLSQSLDVLASRNIYASSHEEVKKSKKPKPAEAEPAVEAPEPEPENEESETAEAEPEADVEESDAETSVEGSTEAAVEESDAADEKPAEATEISEEKEAAQVVAAKETKTKVTAFLSKMRTDLETQINEAAKKGVKNGEVPPASVDLAPVFESVAEALQADLQGDTPYLGSSVYLTSLLNTAHVEQKGGGFFGIDFASFMSGKKKGTSFESRVKKYLESSDYDNLDDGLEATYGGADGYERIQRDVAAKSLDLPEDISSVTDPDKIKEFHTEQKRQVELLNTIDFSDPTAVQNRYKAFVEDNGKLDYESWIGKHGNLSDGESFQRNWKWIANLFKIWQGDLDFTKIFSDPEKPDFVTDQEELLSEWKDKMQGVEKFAENEKSWTDASDDLKTQFKSYQEVVDVEAGNVSAEDFQKQFAGNKMENIIALAGDANKELYKQDAKISWESLQTLQENLAEIDVKEDQVTLTRGGNEKILEGWNDSAVRSFVSRLDEETTKELGQIYGPPTDNLSEEAAALIHEEVTSGLDNQQKNMLKGLRRIVPEGEEMDIKGMDSLKDIPAKKIHELSSLIMTANDGENNTQAWKLLTSGLKFEDLYKVVEMQDKGSCYLNKSEMYLQGVDTHINYHNIDKNQFSHYVNLAYDRDFPDSSES